VASIIGIGRIVAAEDAGQGRIDVLLAGLARARIARELPPTRAYRQVVAELVDDRPVADASSLEAEVGKLVAVCDRLADVLPAGGGELRQLCRLDAEPGLRCDRVAGLLVTDPDQRQAFLEEPDAARRARALIEHASRILIELSEPPAGPLN